MGTVKVFCERCWRVHEELPRDCPRPMRRLAGSGWERNKRRYRGGLTRAVRTAVLTRANGRCAICHGRPDKLEVDHIVPASEGGTGDMANLQALCVACHRAKTRAESKRGAKRAAARRAAR